jgi:hypothetical protein
MANERLLAQALFWTKGANFSESNSAKSVESLKTLQEQFLEIGDDEIDPKQMEFFKAFAASAELVHSLGVKTTSDQLNLLWKNIRSFTSVPTFQKDDFMKIQIKTANHMIRANSAISSIRLKITEDEEEIQITPAQLKDIL